MQCPSSLWVILGRCLAKTTPSQVDWGCLKPLVVISPRSGWTPPSPFESPLPSAVHALAAGS